MPIWAGETFLPEPQLFTFASKNKLAPGFQGSHFKSLSGYSLCRETETQEIEYFIHLSLGIWQSKEWILALQILTYHRDAVRLMAVGVSELHQCLPCWKELTVLHHLFPHALKYH